MDRWMPDGIILLTFILNCVLTGGNSHFGDSNSHFDDSKELDRQNSSERIVAQVSLNKKIF